MYEDSDENGDNASLTEKPEVEPSNNETINLEKSEKVPSRIEDEDEAL